MSGDTLEKEVAGKYLHYKNIPVTVHGIARHSETLEELVVYTHGDTGELWVRPKDMFFENIMLEGVEVPRFRKLED
jgi:hypothetical protein